MLEGGGGLMYIFFVIGVREKKTWKKYKHCFSNTGTGGGTSKPDRVPHKQQPGDKMDNPFNGRLSDAVKNIKHKCNFSYKAPMPEWARVTLGAETDAILDGDDSGEGKAQALEALSSVADRLLSIKYYVCCEIETEDGIDDMMEALNGTDLVGPLFALCALDHKKGADIVVKKIRSAPLAQP